MPLSSSTDKTVHGLVVTIQFLVVLLTGATGMGQG